MRILQVTPYFPPSIGGVQFYTHQLSRHLALLGQDVLVLSTGSQSWDQTDLVDGPYNVQRYPIDISIFRAVISQKLFAEILYAAGNVDVIHIHIPFHFGLEVATISSLLRRVPIVATYHGEGYTEAITHNFLSMMYQVLYKNIVIRFLDRIIFLTDSYRLHVKLPKNVYGKTRVLATGADITTFSPEVSGKNVRKNYGIDEDVMVVLFVASLCEGNQYKGLDYLLKAFTIVNHEYSSAKLLVVGGGELQKKYQDLAEKLDISSNIIFTGSIPNSELPEVYAASDIFILPSVRGPENSPVVVFEAMASGKPVLASSLPGVRDLISEGETGFLFPPADPNAISSTICKLIQDPKVAEKIGQNARKKVEMHTWDDCARQMISIYEELI